MLLLPTLITLLSLLTPALTSCADNLAIRNVLSEYAFDIDSKAFSSLSAVFTTNATYTFGGSPPVVAVGLTQIEAVLSSAVVGAVTQTAISTNFITLTDFDTLRNATVATAKSYSVSTYLGQGNLTGQIAQGFARLDDVLVKTAASGSNGWRIESRVLTLLSPFTGNTAIVPALGP
ncbi:MAG: hypothetical protein M1827_003051 [Pycnora praestabilis]|nr:MAG: hypothetical protein M1827_003051 [Pycnora praestabilis]